MNPNAVRLAQLKSIYGDRLLVAAGEPESSMLRDAMMRDPAGMAGFSQFATRDPAFLAHIERMLDRQYCVGVLPLGPSSVGVISSPTLRFLGVSTRPYTGASGPGSSRAEPPPRSAADVAWERERERRLQPSDPGGVEPWFVGVLVFFLIGLGLFVLFLS